MIGKSIGQYTIVEKIGEGGMGEVYRATDSSLKRDVALKFLPESMAQDETARRRFLREARSAAALDHPYICQIHEIGEVEGVGFIAMEYVSGQMLKDKLAAALMPVSESLRIATEIAEALDRAQEKGIVHRDLKPANIMLTSGGHVKLMDFGLAKHVAAVGEDQVNSLTQLTREGSTVGTVPYMSPEQLKGEAVDFRSDIFSFGIILYEMLTGVHPFIKPDAMATASSILQEEPAPVGMHRAGISAVVQYIVRKMLAKQPERRYQLVGDIHTDLTTLQETGEFNAVPTLQDAAEKRAYRAPLLWLMIPLALLAAWVGWTVKPGAPDVGHRPFLSEISLPEGQRLEHNYRLGLTLSPDGKYLAYTSAQNPREVLYSTWWATNRLSVRRLEDGSIQEIPDSERAYSPVFSPDSQWIAFYTYDPGRWISGGEEDRWLLKKVPVTGGNPIGLVEQVGTPPFGLSWGDAGIVFSRGRNYGLEMVSENGGEIVSITDVDAEAGEAGHASPSFLPDGSLLFTALPLSRNDWDKAGIYAFSPKTGKRQLLLQNATEARYSPSGHLVFAREGDLYARPFDAAGLSLSDPEVRVLEGVAHSIQTGHGVTTSGVAQYGFNESGLLAYASGSDFSSRPRTTVWVDRQGRSEPLDLPFDFARPLRVSNDGRLALMRRGGRNEIWLYDTERGTSSFQHKARCCQFYTNCLGTGTG